MGDITISRNPAFPNQQPVGLTPAAGGDAASSFSTLVSSVASAAETPPPSTPSAGYPAQRNPTREMTPEEIASLGLTPGGTGMIDTAGNTSVFGAVPLNKAAEDAAMIRGFDVAAVTRLASVYRTTYRLTGTDEEVAAEGMRRDQIATRIADNSEVWGGSGGASDAALPELGDAAPSDAYARSLTAAGVDLSWTRNR